MPRNAPHDGTIRRASDRLPKFLPAGWNLSVQCAITLTDSEPEPDFAILRAVPDYYSTRLPTAADAGLVIEVADSTLAGDRADKGRIYARAGIECYWIINLVDHQIEVYTSPSGPGGSPSYAGRQDYRPGDAIPLVLAGTAVTSLPVQDLLP
jgi:Uma2 family endonuclease